MRLIKSNILDLPVSLFYHRYGINIDDALDLIHERGKILSPILARGVTVSTGNVGDVATEAKVDELYLFFLSDIMIKNDKVVTFKEEIVEVK